MTRKRTATSRAPAWTTNQELAFYFWSFWLIHLSSSYVWPFFAIILHCFSLYICMSLHVHVIRAYMYIGRVNACIQLPTACRWIVLDGLINSKLGIVRRGWDGCMFFLDPGLGHETKPAWLKSGFVLTNDEPLQFWFGGWLENTLIFEFFCVYLLSESIIHSWHGAHHPDARKFLEEATVSSLSCATVVK